MAYNNFNYDYDAIIVGAGPAGSATAYYAAQSGLRVLLLDKAEFPRDKTCGDGLSPRALSVLREMSLLEKLNELGFPVRAIEFIAPKGHHFMAQMPKTKDGIDYTLIVSRFISDDLIRKQAVSVGAAFQDRVKVTNIVPDSGGVTVQGEQGEQTEIRREYRARIVIIATGANSSLLVKTGILPEPPPMFLAARTYFSSPASSSKSLAHAQSYFSDVPLPGYGWVFPMINGGYNAGVYFRPGQTRTSNQNQKSETAQGATGKFLHSPPLTRLLQDATQVGPIKGYPIRTNFLNSPTYGQRILLVGEAAGLVNPLTGEGIDTALESGRIAGQQLLKMCRSGDFSLSSHRTYHHLLQKHFRRQFIISNLMWNISTSAHYFNLVVGLGAIKTPLSPPITRSILTYGFGWA